MSPNRRRGTRMTNLNKISAKADAISSFGSEIRQVRKARGLTLQRLSKISGISLSHLSAIERGASNPSFETMQQLSEALNVSTDWFFARRTGSGPLERAYVVRSQNRRNLLSLYGQDEVELGYSDALLSSSIGGRFYMGIASYSPTAAVFQEGTQQHEGELHGLVLSGEFEMQIGDEIFTLHEGDSFSFEAEIPYRVRNRSGREAKLLWAVSPVVIPTEVSSEQKKTQTGPKSVGRGDTP